eukprot:SAG31_NODE_2996_length_4803_cov_8.948342_2_plen_64_part_00
METSGLANTLHLYHVHLMAPSYLFPSVLATQVTTPLSLSLEHVSSGGKAIRAKRRSTCKTWAL